MSLLTSAPTNDLFHRHETARGFFRGVLGFVGEHPGLGAAGTFPLLAADFFNLGALRGHEAIPLFLNLVEQQPAGDVAVESLLAGFLAFHLTCRSAGAAT